MTVTSSGAETAESPPSTGAPKDRVQRVLLVTASARRRGAEIQATQLATALREGHLSVDVVALSSGTDGTPLPLRALGLRRLAPSTIWRLRRAAREQDVVVAYGSSTLPACALALAGTSVPFVYRSISDPARWVRHRLHRAVTAFQYRRPAKVVALWPSAAAAVIDVFGVPAERVSVIPNARDQRTFYPPTHAERSVARDRFGVDDRCVIAFIGSMTPEKRTDLAIATVRMLPGHVLLVAGAGAGLDEARHHAERVAAGQVIFAGEVTDIVSVLHASDVVLITSDVEGMPGAAIEAALCGLPVVATPAGALPTMPWVQISQGDPRSLATALTAATGGATDPASAATFTWQEVAPAWNLLLDEVWGSAQRSRP